MTKFNKSLLAAAVVGALAIPSLATAAQYKYVAGQQITYAKDLFVDDTKSIDSPNGLQLIAEASDNNASRITNIALGEVLTVKVTLGQGAIFDSTYPADTLVQLFLEGTQTGGAGAAINYVPGTANYNGNELNFQYTTTGAGNVGAGYFLQLNSAKIKNLIGGLFNGSSITSQITVQNGDGQQVLAGNVVYAESKWGLAVSSDPTLGNVNTTIDVGADPRKTFFASTGVVGQDDQAFFNAGQLTLDIAKAIQTQGAAPGTYVNNYSATATQPDYNVVATADIIVKVTGSDLTAFGGNRVWLDQNAGCTKAAGAFTNGVIGTGANAGVATFTSPANSNLWQNVTNAPPTASPVYVCFGANHAAEMQAQNLSGTLEVDYNLAQQRVNPPAFTFDLLPLRLNGTTIIFQNVNPAGNATAQSFLRLTNNTAQICPITIDAKDDAGKHSGEVKLTLAPHGSKQVNSEVLEGAATAAGVTGGFGDGAGKWYVRVTAECADLQASALNRHQDGVVTDLTPEKGNDTWLTPPTSL
ncbi:MAG: hypothetical protein WA956_06605 [Stenotrophomonas sp.]